MSRLKDIFPERFKYEPKDFMGLEFEVEAYTSLPNISGTWKTSRDDSLRGVAFEYVTQKPLNYGEVGDSIEKILAKLKSPEYDPVLDSPRTSWHVHVNTGGYSPSQFLARLMTYWIMEPQLIKLCGKRRKQNTFALQLNDSREVLNTFDESFYVQMHENPQWIFDRNYFNDFNRYCSQNLVAFKKFGSIEYRAMEGSFDKDQVILWTKMLHAIWQVSPFNNPDDLFDVYYDKGYEGLAEKLFIDFKADYLKKVGLPDRKTEELVEENALLLMDVIEECPYDWDEWDKKCHKVVRRLKPQPFVRPQQPRNLNDPLWMIAPDVRERLLNVGVAQPLFEEEEDNF